MLQNGTATITTTMTTNENKNENNMKKMLMEFIEQGVVRFQQWYAGLTMYSAMNGPY
jgi:hypothetical protein